MKKLAMLGIAGLVTGLFAIQNGFYKCIATKIADIKTGFAYKLSKDQMSSVEFTVKNDGRNIVSSKKNFEYIASKNGYDIFKMENKNMLILMPSNNVSGYFGGGIVQGNTEIIMVCKKVK